EANIDGYRCDVAGEVPTDFWEWVRPQLDDIKPVFMLAESEKPDLLNSAFDMNYGWEFHHLMNSIAKGEKNATDVYAYLKNEKETYPQDSYMLYFLTNHDENSWNGTIKERMGESADAFAVLTYTLGGMPLTYSGQESANEKRLEFFEKDVIDWKDYSKHDFISELIEMKHQNPAIWNGAYGGAFSRIMTSESNQILAFTKVKDDNDMLIIINLSNDEVSASVMSGKLAGYEPVMTEGFVIINDGSINMKPWAYAVLRK
ncbi:MAG: alpha-amylase, partial [Bacteroidales bacterium]|nr:alpha-amylase [Bacteroidales bacterium]